MKPYIFPVFIVLILTLLLSGCAGGEQKPQANSSITPVEQSPQLSENEIKIREAVAMTIECKNFAKANYSQKAACIKKVTLKLKNAEMCKAIEGPEGNECAFAVAIETKNATECENSNSIGKCYGQYALDANDETVCGIASEKGDCYFLIATNKSDEWLCEKAQAKRDFCIKTVAVMQNKSELCDKTNGSSKDYCLLNLAQANLDLPACKKIADNSTRTFCISFIAEKNADSEICSEITDKIENGKCVSKIAIAASNETLCQKLEGGENCIFQIAVKNSNDALCSKIQNITVKDDCLETIGKHKPDTMICEKIQNKNKTAECIGSVAINTNNEALCNRSDNAGFCYFMLAGQKKDIMLCGNAREYQSECIKGFMGINPAQVGTQTPESQSNQSTNSSRANSNQNDSASQANATKTIQNSTTQNNTAVKG